MSHLHEKIAFLRGLSEGLKGENETNENRLFSKVLEILEDIADDLDSVYDEIDEVALAVEELEDYTEAIDEDLTDLEDCLGKGKCSDKCSHDFDEYEDFDGLDDFDLDEILDDNCCDCKEDEKCDCDCHKE